jgi:prophage regulatory protein
MAGNRRRDLTLAEAKALADKWHDMAEGIKEDGQLASRFSDAGPHRVIEMWETGRVIEDSKAPHSRNGKPLSKFETAALVERWCELFGCHPPDMNDGTMPATPRPPPVPEPPDSAMLSIRQVIPLAGISKSNIKRLLAAGDFPKPVKLSVRRNGWPAAKVKEWRARREAGLGWPPTA